MSDVIQSLLDETFALEHYGVKGQKWGQRNYQNPDGTYTELGKERRRVGHKKTESADDESEGKISGKAYKDMSRSERRAAKRKARHNEAERRERREFNRDKAEAIKSGNLEFINKHISKFSNDEIMEAADRYKRMQLIKDMQRAEKEAEKRDHEAFIDKGLRFLKKASDATDSLTNIYNKINQSAKNKTDLEKAKVQLKDAQLSYDKNADPKKYKTEKYMTDLEMKEAEAKTKEAEARLKKATSDMERDQLDLENKRRAADRDALDSELKKIEVEAKRSGKEVALITEQSKRLELEQKKAADEEAKATKAAEKALKDYEDAVKRQDIDAQQKANAEYMKRMEERERASEEAYRAQQEAEAKKAQAQAYRDYADDIARREKEIEDSLKEIKSQEKAAKKEAKKAKEESSNYDLGDLSFYTNPYDFDSYWSKFSGAQKKSLIAKVLGSDKIKDYESYKPSKNRTYELEDLNKESRNAIKKIAKEKPTDKFGDYAQDKQWTKDMKKHDSRYIDKWVDDMKKKYMKERNMDAKAAEAKAEEYVDAWIDAYDEGRILV